MLVEETAEFVLEPADLSPCATVLLYEGDQPGKPVVTSDGGADVGIDALEVAKQRLGLACRGDLLTDLGGQLVDLVLSVCQREGA